MQKRGFQYLILTIVLGVISGVLYKFSPYKMGLDVKGGVRLTYQVTRTDTGAQPGTQGGSQPGGSGQTGATTSGNSGQSMSEVLAKTILILQNRISGMTGVSDSTVYQKGGDQIVVELPEFTNVDQAEKVVGTSASLKVYWAKNVNTANVSYRPYTVGAQDTKSKNPEVDFINNFTKKTITPDDADYQQMIAGWQLLAKGDQLKSASPAPAPGGGYKPTMQFNADAGNNIRQWTTQYRNQGEQIAFVLDGKVLQIAPVAQNTILSTDMEVEGSYPSEYVNSLCALLNAGALPVDLKLFSSETVDPTIGSSALTKMVEGGIAAFGVICLFLIVYYSFPGIIATLALGLYCLFTLTVLKMFGATFSLAAIAGFVLSVGMAVDANILVFERFKEEIKRGHPLHKAMDLGFRRALPAIFDSNMCSILVSIMLVYVGTGPVKGFATTLIIGVLISLFTAVTVTRSLLFFLIDSGIGHSEKMYALNRNWFGEHLEGAANSEPLQIVNNSKKWFTITAIIVLIGVVFLLPPLKGMKFNVEFTGGLETTYVRTDAFPSLAQINANLAKSGVHGANVQFSKSDKGSSLVNITIPSVGGDLGKLNSGQQNDLVVNDAGLPAGSKFVSSSFIGPAVQQETVASAIWGVLGAFVLIIVWLGIRFGYMMGSFKNGLRFGMVAIATGVKDLLVIAGVAAICGKLLQWELSSLFIPAMLTVIGFSVHDKIVIFDRVRENLRKPLSGETFDHLVNRSVTQSFARSINTASAVVVTLLILIIFGTTTTDLRFFVLLMMTGIAWSTYSSIYTSAPLLTWWEDLVLKRKGEEETLMVSVRNQTTASAYQYSASAAPVKKAAKKIPTAPIEPDRVPTPKPENKPNAAPGGRSYGQVRRANQQKQRHDHDDEP